MAKQIAIFIVTCLFASICLLQYSCRNPGNPDKIRNEYAAAVRGLQQDPDSARVRFKLQLQLLGTLNIADDYRRLDFERQYWSLKVDSKQKALIFADSCIAKAPMLPTANRDLL